MPCFYSLSANEQTALALVISLLLSEGLNENELNILGNFIEAVGQNILLIQAVVSSVPTATTSTASPACDPCQEIAALRTRVEELEKRYKKSPL